MLRTGSPGRLVPRFLLPSSCRSPIILQQQKGTFMDLWSGIVALYQEQRTECVVRVRCLAGRSVSDGSSLLQLKRLIVGVGQCCPGLILVAR